MHKIKVYAELAVVLSFAFYIGSLNTEVQANTSRNAEDKVVNEAFIRMEENVKHIRGGIDLLTNRGGLWAEQVDKRLDELEE